MTKNVEAIFRQKVSSINTIDPSKLDQKAMTELCHKLYAVHCQIFDGVNATQFEKKVFAPDAKWTKIRVFKNTEGKLVGYCSLHAFEKLINSKNVVIFRAEAGMLRDYRKQGNASSFFFKEAIKYKLCHPFTKSYLFCTLVHPSSYHLINKNYFLYYPRINHIIPSDIFDTMSQIADAFDEVKLPDGPPSRRDAGWVTRQTPEELNELANSPDPDTLFFLQENPDYHKGHGLLTLVPISVVNILMTSFTVLFSRASNRIRRSSEKRTVNGS